MIRRVFGVAVMLAVLPLPLDVQAAGSQVMCDQAQSGNVYATPQDALKQCGFVIYPLESVTTNVAGMRVYTYRVNENLVTHTVPATGFSFANATTQQLAEFHLPPRPTDPVALESWLTQMTRVHVAAGPPSWLQMESGRDSTLIASGPDM